MPHPDGYFALVLSPDSSLSLRARYASLANPIAHHCTVRHGTRDPAALPAFFTPADVGRSFCLVVVGFASRHDVEVAVVALVMPDGTRLENGFTANAIPHVTIATDGEAEPFIANALLQAGFERVAEGLLLTATLAHVLPPLET